MNGKDAAPRTRPTWEADEAEASRPGDALPPSQPPELAPRVGPEPLANEEPPLPEGDPFEAATSGSPKRRSGLAGWLERRGASIASRLYEDRAKDLEDRALRVFEKIYEARVHDLESRAKRIVGHAYDSRADDLEQRAVRALRQAVRLESRRIRLLVEASLEVKRREVRLSLLVLLAATIVYFVLWWVQGR